MDDLKKPDTSESTVVDYYAYSQLLAALSKDERKALSSPREFAKELRIGSELGDLEAEALKPDAALELDAFRRSQEAALRTLFAFLLEEPVDQLKNALETRLYPAKRGDAEPRDREAPILPQVVRTVLFAYIARALRERARKKQNEKGLLDNLQKKLSNEAESILKDKTVQLKIHRDANQRANSGDREAQDVQQHVRDIVIERLLGALSPLEELRP